jgi:uncharacterized protein (DUF433 family)
MVATAESLLGIGLYTVDQAALYAGVPSQTMGRWIYGNARGQAVFTPQLGAATSEKFVTFLDFVQAIHIRQIRADFKIPLTKIRQAIDVAQTAYDVQYPFAMRHTTYIFGSEVIIKLNDEEFAQLSGEHRRHRLISQVVKLHMKDLTFDDNGLAKCYQAWKYGPINVEMNPAFRFGEPLIPSCGYSAHTLWEAAKAEGGFEAAAAAYGVTADEVEVGYRFYNQLQAAHSA